MKEIIYPQPEYEKSNTDEKCPSCGGDMRWDTIPCPDGIQGCLVIHNGYICLKCGKIFQWKPKWLLQIILKR